MGGVGNLLGATRLARKRPLVSRVARTAPAKLAVASFVALILSSGLVACGGSDSESTSPSASNEDTVATQPKAGEGDGATGKGADEEAGKSASAGQEKSGGSTEGGGSSASGAYHGPSASSFVPKSHEDSRTGSEQFRQEGEDGNSLQDFGSEAEGSEFDEVATAFHNFLDARAEGNWAAMCEYWGSDIIKSLTERGASGGATGCAALIESQGAYTAAAAIYGREAEKADVASIRIDGDRAFAIYWGMEGNVYAFPMGREADGWKITAIAPLPVCVRSLRGEPTAIDSCTNG